MNKTEIEEELNSIFKNIKNIIDNAYICGYRDGYYECMFHKYRAIEEEPEIKDYIQISM